MVLTIVAATGLRIILLRENARRDDLRHSNDGSATAIGSRRDEKGDNEVDHLISTGNSNSRGIVEEKTDKQDFSFRYTL
jgi:hypothetical protein